jgi:hypothetical protein
MALSDDEKKFITAIVAVAAASGVVYFSYRAWQQSHILADAAHDVRGIAGSAEAAVSRLLPGQTSAPPPAPTVYTATPTPPAATAHAAPHQASSGSYASDAIQKNAAYKQAHPAEWSSAMSALRGLGYDVAADNPSNIAAAHAIAGFQGARGYMKDVRNHADWQPRRLTQDGKMGPNTLAALANYRSYLVGQSAGPHPNSIVSTFLGALS